MDVTLHVEHPHITWRELYLAIGERRLRVDLELSGVPDHQWGGWLTDLAEWDDPAHLPTTDAERAALVAAVDRWAAGLRVRVLSR